jgi:hypothetical protein
VLSALRGGEAVVESFRVQGAAEMGHAMSLWNAIDSNDPEGLAKELRELSESDVARFLASTRAPTDGAPAESPLERCVRRYFWKCVEVLVEFGAEPDPWCSHDEKAPSTAPAAAAGGGTKGSAAPAEARMRLSEVARRANVFDLYEGALKRGRTKYLARVVK